MGLHIGMTMKLLDSNLLENCNAPSTIFFGREALRGLLRKYLLNLKSATLTTGTIATAPAATTTTISTTTTTTTTTTSSSSTTARGNTESMQMMTVLRGMEIFFKLYEREGCAIVFRKKARKQHLE